MSVDTGQFADIMTALAGGVAIVTTTEAGGTPRGLTTTAVASVSAAPPMLLVCVDRTSRTLAALRRTGRFAVNLVNDGAGDVCRRFASKDDDKFEGLRWREHEHGLPILHEHSLAWATCSTVTEIPAGDHVILLAEVDGGRGPKPGDRPLTYYQRCWGTWQPAE